MVLRGIDMRLLILFLTVSAAFLMRSSWMYLAAILDWYSRYVVSWELDQTMQIAFVIEAMQRALARARPQICNSEEAQSG